jgi:hypothetical protein
LAAFVIATDEGDEIGVSDFVCEEKEEGFDAVEAAVYEIT